MTKVYICRHANTFDKGDIVTRVGARTDLPLSNSGMDQAKKLGEHLASINFDSAYCSPLLRTRQTAEAIFSFQTEPPDLVIAEFLKEIDYGPDENMPEPMVLARIGSAALEAWEREATPPEGWLVNTKKITEDWRKFFGELSPSDAENVLVMTSNGTARFVFDVVDDVNVEAPRKLKTASYGVLSVHSSGRLAIEEWGVRP